MAFNIEQVDVAICGGGPVGLLTAYGLLKAGVTSCVIERDVKSDMPAYGRACSLFPRSLELLDSYGLLRDMTQIGFIDRTTFTHKPIDRVSYPRDQQRSSRMDNTFFDYVLNLRSKFTEAIIQGAYERGGGAVAVGWQVTDIAVDTTKPAQTVVLRIKNLTTGDFKIIKSKYLVGADGVRSTVREFAGIRVSRSNLTSYWVRVDGIIETDFPDAGAGQCSIDSSTHGLVLFCRLDQGRTRIGFSLTPDLWKRYGLYITQDQAVYEAQQALKPWRCEIKEVDWYTCYSARNGIAETFLKDPIVLVGDAGHTHASGAGQGLNAGIYDATNLAWKLAGVSKEIFDPSILETYNSERRPIVERLINLDEQLPKVEASELTQDPDIPVIAPAMSMAEMINETTQLNIGLDVCYPENTINKGPTISMLGAGRRAPDGLVYSPGSKIPTRMHETMRYDGRFNIMVFTGEPLRTYKYIISLRWYMDHSPKSIMKLYPDILRYMTILVGSRVEAEVDLGCQRFGDIWLDHDSSVHYAYGVGIDKGAVVVIRPDGVVGFAAGLDEGEKLTAYFGGFMKERSR